MELNTGYKQTEFGRIPEDWHISSVGTEFFVQLGKMLDSEKNVGVFKPFLGNRAVQWGRIDLTNIGAIRLTSSDMQRFRLRDGDLLVCEGGEVGRAAVWVAPISECYYQKALHRLRPKRGYSTALMLNVLQYLAATHRLDGYVTQTSIAHLPKDKFETVPIPVPPTGVEQKAITEALSDADALIEALEQLLDKKRQIKQGAMQELLTGRTRLYGFEARLGRRMTEVGEIPKEWTVVPFYKAVRMFLDFRGRTPRKLGLAWGGGDIRALSADNVQMGRIDSAKDAYFGGEELYKKWMTQGDCERGDVLLTTEAPLGNVAQITDSKRYILSQRVVLVKAEHSVDSSYLMHYMTGPLFQAQLHRNASGTTAKGIQRQKLEQIPIALPSTRTEQTQIAEVLSDMEDEIDQIQLRLSKARAIKQAMLQELLTGRIRLVDAKTAHDLELVQSA